MDRQPHPSYRFAGLAKTSTGNVHPLGIDQLPPAVWSMTAFAGGGAAAAKRCGARCA
jgi:hypothetical protein